MGNDNKNLKYSYVAISIITSFGYFAIIIGAGHKFNINNFDHRVSTLYLLLTIINSITIFSNHTFWKIISFFTLISSSGFYVWAIYNLFDTKIEIEDIEYTIKIAFILSILLLFSIYMIFSAMVGKKK
jgi:hypothetical protein